MSRVGLGCMRLSTDLDRDEDRAVATLRAAIEAGITWLDTAHAYGRDETDLGHNERLIARLKPPDHVRIVTKCGMTRDGQRWEPDGRAGTIRAHATASVEALGRVPDVLLLHAPDPKVPLATSVRALLRAKSDGLARVIGLSNVTRGQLDAIRDVEGEIALVEVAVGGYDDVAARGGVLAWCKARGVPLLAHSPLGGPQKAKRLLRDPVLAAVSARHEATPAQIMIAYLLCLGVIPIVGARRPEAATAAAAADRIALSEADLAQLDRRFPGLASTRRPRTPPHATTGVEGPEVVIIMGGPGSGKSRLASEYVARGYTRLNRDDLGGTLAGIAKKLDEALANGTQKLVLDNTYVTRASRTDVIMVAHGRGASVRCIHLQTSPADAQINVVGRMLERHGALLGGVELAQRSKKDSSLFAPKTLGRMEKTFEAPASDEGFSEIEIVPFVRRWSGTRSGLAIPVELALRRPDVARDLPPADCTLVFGWRPDDAVRIREQLGGMFEDVGLCGHASGPAVCWCRPPLPGLWVEFARRRDVDPRRSAFVALTTTHEQLARAVGASIIPLPP